MVDNLSSLSYNISCDHIRKLNEKYNNLNNEVFKQQFICIEPELNMNLLNIRYLNNLYISKKSCIYTSTEPDQLEWTANFNDNSSPLGFEDDNAKVRFNQNTRRKII